MILHVVQFCGEYAVSTCTWSCCRTVLIICRSLILRISRVWNRLQNNFSENLFFFKVQPHWRCKRRLYFSTLRQQALLFNFLRLQLVSKHAKSAKYYCYNECAPTRNSLIVGVTYSIARITKIIPMKLKKQLSRGFRPAKCKRYTVFQLQHNGSYMCCQPNIWGPQYLRHWL